MKDFARISVLELVMIILFKNKKYVPCGTTVEYYISVLLQSRHLKSVYV